MAAPGIPGWQLQILRGVGAPPTPENVRYINAWAQAEGGRAENNPFNTTQPGYGETGDYNSVHVKRYGTPQGGIQATIHTLQNGHYGNILAALKQGTSAMADAQALAASPWGTGALVEKVLGGPVSAPKATGGSTATTASPQPMGTNPALTRQRIAQLVFGNNKVDFNSNQVAPPNLMALALARQQAGPAAPTAPGQQGAPQVPGTSVGAAIAKTALTQIGIPYQWGGAAKLGGRTDCSGLLQASAAAHGVNIGRTTWQQIKQGTPVPLNQLQPGDAVFSHNGGHVSIYIGNGKVVQDPHTGAVVSISTLDKTGVVGARRFG